MSGTSPLSDICVTPFHLDTSDMNVKAKVQWPHVNVVTPIGKPGGGAWVNRGAGLGNLPPKPSVMLELDWLVHHLH